MEHENIIRRATIARNLVLAKDGENRRQSRCLGGARGRRCICALSARDGKAEVLCCRVQLRKEREDAAS